MLKPDLDKFKLKDYTTGITVEKSVALIEKMLWAVGATDIIKTQDAGLLVGLAFRLDGKTYKVPSNPKGVLAFMYGGKRPHYSTDGMKHREEQAYRVAWKLLSDWLHSELSMIIVGQRTPEQAFFADIYDGKRTLFQAYQEGLLEVRCLPEHQSQDNEEVKIIAEGDEDAAKKR